jgi:hypothetical protein
VNILSTVLGSTLEEGWRIIKVLCFGKDDVRTADPVAPYGIDSNPVNGMSAIYAPTADIEQAVIIGYINTSVLADKGELRLYATDADQTVKNYIWLKNDGTILIGGDADHMVRYSKLETAFNQLRTDHNTLVSKFNNHVHTTAGGTGTPSGPTVAGGGIPVLTSTADITPAKITEIKTS